MNGPAAVTATQVNVTAIMSHPAPERSSAVHAENVDRRDRGPYDQRSPVQDTEPIPLCRSVPSPLALTVSICRRVCGETQAL